MARAAPSRTKINTEVTQLASRQPSRRPPGRVRPGRPARRPARVAGDARRSVRDPGRQVVELDCGITVYPPEAEGEPWRAVFTENGQRRYRQAATEAKLAANRNVLKRAYLAAGWRDAGGNGDWTWRSLRHVFCTTALFTCGLDAADVSRMAGHANVRITLDMYVGAVAGVLDRARQATA